MQLLSSRRNRGAGAQIILLLVLALASGCARNQHRLAITQFSTIDAILAGAYDGHWTCRKLRKYGDFGIGTFHGLDGEMIMFDGRIWQIKGDGSVVAANANMTTPFAAVTTWQPQRRLQLPAATNMESLLQAIDRLAPESNSFVAVRIDGQFHHIRARSVPAQSKPYPPLVEVTRTQTEFEFTDCAGTIVGFRAPEFSKGITVPGYHLHFLRADHSGGGHLLDLEIEAATVEVALLDRFLLLLPPHSDQTFQNIDLGIDRSQELHEAER